MLSGLGKATGWSVALCLFSAGPAPAQVPVSIDVRADRAIQSMATSSDGRHTLVASRHPDSLVMFDENRQPVRNYPLTTLDGRVSSRVAGVYHAVPRHSFIVALQDLAELWEISYDPRAEPIHDGLVHDYRMGEGLAKPGFLGVRRTPLDEPLDGFFFDKSYRQAVGSTRAHGASPPQGQVIQLDVRRRIASFPLPGVPEMASAIQLTRDGVNLLAIPNQEDGCVTVVDMQTWQVVPPIALVSRCLSMPDSTQAAGVIEPRSAPDAADQ